MKQCILVVSPSWLGDMVLAQSLYKHLRQQNHEAKIDVLAPRWSFPLLQRMPEVHQAIAMPVRHGELGLLRRYRIARKLAGVYTRAIVLPRSFKSALVPCLARIPVRSGFFGEMRWGLINDFRPCQTRLMPSLAQRFVSLGAPRENPPAVDKLPPPRLRVDHKKAKARMRRLKINADRQVLALAPGAAYGPSKRWPPEFFAAVARHYRDLGWSVWVFGARDDVPAATQVMKSMKGGAVNLCGQTSLEEAIDLLAQTRLLVSNDSGLMHIAAATDVPTLVIYGSTTPDYTPPMSEKKAVLCRRLSCSPCWRRTCRYGHYHCLKKITPQDVIKASASLAKA